MTIERTISAFVLVAILGAASSVARAEVVERVVAVVNDDAIFLSDLRRRAAPFLPRIMSAQSEVERMAAIEQLYRQLLDRMVQEELFIQAAERLQVSVTRAEVDRAIANVRQQSGLSEEDFWSAVEAQGFSREGYRSDVRRQVLRLKVLNTRARGRVNITEDQVREQYNVTVARERRGLGYNVAQIVVSVASDASASDVTAAREQATRIRAGLSSIDQFETQMAQVGGGELGTLSQGDLPEALEEAISRLDAGEISQPVRGPAGFHIFLLRERESGQNAPSYQEARMQIWQHMMEEAMAQQEEIFLGELRRQAVIDIRL